MSKFAIGSRIRVFINNIIKSETEESSKRFISLLSMALIYYVVIRFTNEKNILYVLGTLCSFILTLLGVAAWEKVKRYKKEKENEEL